MDRVIRLTILLGFSLLFSAPNSADARITVAFGVDSIEVSQRAGAIQIPVVISGNPTPNGQFPSSMSYRSQDGTAVFGRDYFYNTDFISGKSWVEFENGDARTKFLTFSIYFTESFLDRTFTVLLDPSDTGFPFATYDADAGSPALVTVKIRGLPPEYVFTLLSIERVKRQMKKARKIKNRKKRSKKIRKLRKKQIFLEIRLNQIE
ncbi:MAG: hypothetical protein AAGC68_07725 [Verrucomicrobiota bacterium]